MTIFKRVLHALATAGSTVKQWFVNHGPDIHTAISEAQGAVAIAAEVATSVDEGGSSHVVIALGKVSAGLTVAGNLVTHEATAETLKDQVAAITAAATDLRGVGIVNTATQAAISAVAGKVDTVAEVLSKAATAHEDEHALAANKA